MGSCPSSITPGGSCSGDNLECPYTIQSTSGVCGSLAADGAVATSCQCTGGVWVCPVCGDDGGAEGGGDATMEDGGGETSVDGGGDVTVEAGSDGSSADSGHVSSNEASADGPVESSSSDSSTSEASTDAAHD